MKLKIFDANYGKWVKTPDNLTGDEHGIGKWYKMIWSRFGGRPYTFMARDFTFQYPLIIILISLGVGIVLGHFYW